MPSQPVSLAGQRVVLIYTFAWWRNLTWCILSAPRDWPFMVFEVLERVLISQFLSLNAEYRSGRTSENFGEISWQQELINTKHSVPSISAESRIHGATCKDPNWFICSLCFDVTQLCPTSLLINFKQNENRWMCEDLSKLITNALYDVISDYTYYSDFRDNRIYRVSKWTGGHQISFYHSSSRAVLGMRVYSTEVQSGKTQSIL